MMEYYNDCNQKIEFTLDSKNLIGSGEFSNIYEVYEFLYNSNNEFAGYTMKFYQKEDIDMLTTDTFFILENFISIYNSIIELSKHNICICDMHANNVIINENKITLIDLDDSYFNHNKSFEDIVYINRNQLGNILKTLFYKSLMLYYGYDFVKLYDERVILELSRKFINNGIDSLCKELEGYKYPIDYVKKYIKIR